MSIFHPRMAQQNERRESFPRSRKTGSALTYDYAERIKTLRTNPTLSSGVPTNAGGSVTTWNYSTTTGWPTSKLDNAGDGPTFTHTNAGRQSTRTWDRGKHTIYDYMNGRQVAVRHLVASGGASDADTPDVGIIYTRMGQPVRMVTSSTANLPGTSIEYTFGAPGLNITQETTQIDPDLTFSVGGSGVTVTAGTVAASIERMLDRKTDSLLRYAGADLRKPDTTLVVGQTLAYHADSGRLDTVTGNLSATNRVFTYGYQANSFGLIASVTGPVHTVTNTWEGTRDVLDKKENKVGATNISTYDYSVNSIGQRSAVDVSGSAFGTQADWNWGYDSLGQVVSAQHVNTGASSRHYTFDAIGNRTQHREGGHTSSTGTPTNYTPTALNQYSAVASLSPTYDSDGNMTSGPIPNAPTVLATFTWDGENRQLSVTPNGGSTTTALRDAMGRRVAKTTGSTRTYFLYDGWNIAAEYTGTVHTTGTPPALTLERTNVWGTDLSGSQQGAGGVGGLLAAYLHNAGGDSGVYYPTYDGNGNVTEYLDGSGAVQSHFEYDPFGNTLVNTDTNSYFPIRFSTKYLDFESGMIHYGFRDYESFTGRWPNHDPIGEEGGVNLYGMVRNDLVDQWDLKGLDVQSFKIDTGWATGVINAEVTYSCNQIIQKSSKVAGFQLNIQFGKWFIDDRYTVKSRIKVVNSADSPKKINDGGPCRMNDGKMGCLMHWRYDLDWEIWADLKVQMGVGIQDNHIPLKNGTMKHVNTKKVCCPCPPKKKK